jgi:dephospho-CoA kinase
MRIAIIGPQNTGKSTFVKDFLLQNKNYVTPTKTYRDVVIEKSLEINQKTSEESQEEIAKFLEKSISGNQEENILFDRCLIDNYVYSYIACRKGNIKETYLEKLKERVLESLKYIDLFVFIPTSVSVKLIEDTLRDTETSFIDETNSVFISFLFYLQKEKGIDIFLIYGDREGRIERLNKRLKKELEW